MASSAATRQPHCFRLVSWCCRTGSWHGERRGSRTLAEAVASYCSTERRSDGTKALLRRIVLATGTVDLAGVTQELVDRTAQRMLRPGAAPATLRRNLIAPLRAVLMHAHRRGWCDAPIFEVPKERAGRTLYLTPAETERLIDAAAPHVRRLVIFLVCTGARMSEALELDWRDVDLTGRRAIFWRTKGGKPRFATLPERVLAMLRLSPEREGAVFRRQDGKPYTSRGRAAGGQIKTAWRATLRRAELRPELTPHDLRHTFASWHYAIHRDVLLLKAEGGWSNITLVERYAHLLPTGLEAQIRDFWHQSGTVKAVTDLSA